MSFRFFGSIFNPSSKSAVGKRPGKFIEITFPLPLESGWYNELKCTRFRTLEHRKEIGGFKHEFIIIRLLDGSLCRIERMGDPNAPFNALGGQGAVAQDIAQYFTPQELNQVQPKPSTDKLISRIELPREFDIIEVLKVCRAIHEGEKTRNYTLRVYNCYFFALAIQVCLTRLIAPWEGEELFEAWSSGVNKSIEKRTNSEADNTLVTLEFHSEHPLAIYFKIFSILNPHSHQTMPRMAEIESRLKSHIAAKSMVLQQDMSSRINDFLWYPTVSSDLKIFTEERVQEILRVILKESFSEAQSTPSTHRSFQELKAEILSSLASLLNPPPHKIRVEHDTQHLKVLRQKWIDDDSPIKNIRPAMTYNAPAKQLPKITSESCRSPFPFILPLVLYYWRYLQCFFLWILQDVQNAWGLVLFPIETHKLPCITLEEKLKSMVATIENLKELTEPHLQSFAGELRALVENKSAFWNEKPWDSVCDRIEQDVLASLLDRVEVSGYELRIQYSEDTDFTTVDVSFFQEHVLGCIKSHAEYVERYYLGSAVVIEAELRETLLRVWRNIRDDAEQSIRLNIEIMACLDILNQAPLSPKIATMVDDLSWFIRTHEDILSTRADYEELRAQLAALFKDFREGFSSSTLPLVHINDSMLSMSEAIQVEMQGVYETQDRDMISKHLQAKDKIKLDKVMECYRATLKHLNELIMIVRLEIEKGLAAEARLRQLNPSISAYFDSTEANGLALQRRECAPNTRVRELLDLSTWKDNSNGEKVCWINGVAGAGKTTILYTLSSLLTEQGELGASFFCSRLLPECRDVKLILPTIAYQLAQSSEAFRDELLRVLAQDPGVHSKALQVQFEHMILEPLQKVEDSIPSTAVVTIDALDECDDVEGVGQILRILNERASELPIKIIISSRPERHVLERFQESRFGMQLILHELDETAVEADVVT